MFIYEKLCLYGESYTRTLIVAALTIILFAVLRTLFELKSLNLILSMDAFLEFLKSLPESLRVSTAAFSQIYFDNSWLTVLERLISIPILGALYIALRRKLERRVRH
ncbi:MAG: hypothetical protein ACP5H3_03565 [Candidatus Aenigmatarchaeota archaeon]|jgi:hypothetical protein